MGCICSSALCRICPACPCCGYQPKGALEDQIMEVMRNWMERLGELAPSIKLKQLKMMTSHDCGTYSIPKHVVGSSLSRTQSVDVYAQLDMGIRHIDFRYGPNGANEQDLAVRHGPHSGANYFRELIKVKHWLEDNPYEFLVIYAKCEKKVSPEQRSYVIDFYRKKFSSLLITKKDLSSWFNIDDVTLGQLRQYHPKRVMLLVDEMILSNPKEEEALGNEGFLNSSKLMVSDWHNTGSVSKLFSKIQDDVKMVPLRREQFVNLQLILTPKIHAQAIAKYCVCMDRTRIDQKQRLLFMDRKVQYFIRDLGNQQINFVMMDFINYDPNIVVFLVGLNFPFKLNILQGYVVNGNTNLDVTDKLRALVTNQNTLWLVNYGKDLDLKFSTSTLHIVYEYEQNRTVHKQVKMQRDQQYLLNCITHLDVTLEDRESRAKMMEEFHRRKTAIFKDHDEHHNSPTGSNNFRFHNNALSPVFEAPDESRMDLATSLTVDAGNMSSGMLVPQSLMPRPAPRHDRPDRKDPFV